MSKDQSNITSNQPLSMADLLAQQETKPLRLFRGQEIEGTVVMLLPQEAILELGAKSEGVLPLRELPSAQRELLKIGDTLTVFVLHTENESGQVVLGLHKALPKSNQATNPRFRKFEEAMLSKQTLSGKGVEVNKGGLIIEVNGIRGFLPSSQVALSQAANLEELVGKDVQVMVIEVDPSQNRLIFTQKANVSEDAKQKLSKLKVSDEVTGEVAAVLPFGIFVSLPDGIEGLVHISEIAWEKVEDPGSVYKIGDEVSAKVVSIDPNSNRVNLSIKQLEDDPFTEKTKDIQPDDVLKVTVTKVSNQGISVALADGIEGIIAASKMEDGVSYEIGQSITCLVDSVDTQKRRVNLVPFITSTKDLIYK